MAEKSAGGLVIAYMPPVQHNAGAEIGFRLISDPHLGSGLVDEKLLRSELDDAQVRDDGILVGGDVFDGILPGDRRYKPSVLHPKLQGRDDVADAAIALGFDVFAPYAANIRGMGVGNHEAAVERRCSTDMVQSLIERLNTHRIVPSPGRIVSLGYTALIRVPIFAGRRLKRCFDIFYHHGSGSATTAPKALARLEQRSHMMKADVYWSGHYHQRATVHDVVIEPTADGDVVYRDVRYILTGSYLNPYQVHPALDVESRGRLGNYVSDEGLPMRGMGGARLVLTLGDKPGSIQKVQVIL